MKLELLALCRAQKQLSRSVSQSLLSAIVYSFCSLGEGLLQIVFFSAFPTCEIHLLSLLHARKVLIQKKLLHFFKKKYCAYAPVYDVYKQYVSMKLFVYKFVHEEAKS